jgi:hypothetical protein
LRATEFIASLPQSVTYSPLAAELWRRLAERVPDFIRDMYRSEQLAVGVIEKHEPKIEIHYLPNRNYAVVLHDDLPNLIYRVVRAAFCQVSLSRAKQTENSTLDGDKFTQVLVDILWWFKETGTVFGPEYPIGDSQKSLSNLLTIETESFLLAHELGHLLVKPGIEALPEDLVERLISGSYRGFIASGTSEWDEEHIADLLGLELVMGILTGATSPEGWVNQLRYAGVELMLLIEYAMEQLGFEVSSTHPPAAKRLQVIRTHMRQACSSDEEYEQLTMFASLFERFVVNALTRYHHPDHAEYKAQSSESLRRIDAALEAHSKASPANYLLFYQEMNDVLGLGYFQPTLRKLRAYIEALRPVDPEGAIAIEFASITGAELSPEQETTVHQFRMYKLILGYFSRQANPLGWYMMRHIHGTPS